MPNSKKTSNAKYNLGWPIVIALAVLPVVIWCFLKPIGDRFVTFPVTLTSIGQITGLVGMSLFALNMVLAARFRFLEDYFGGMNAIYKAHYLIGSVSFVFLLVHPSILAVKYLQVSLKSAALLLLPGADWTINFGIISIFSMIAFLVLTFYVKLPYHVWRYTHKFLGMAFFFGGLHAFLVPSDISGYALLKYYMLFLSALGVASLAYRSLLGRILVRKHEYIVDSIRQLAGDVVEIFMLPKRAPMDFSPGQFVFIRFRHGGIKAETHPFSISSAPGEDRLRLSIKSLGDYTSRLKELRAGALAEIEGPFGRFSYKNAASKSQIWIAGGIGITPFLSMARSLEGNEYSVDLYYCVSSRDEAVFRDELVMLSANNKNFRHIPFCSDTDGRINADVIERLSKGLAGKDIFICGPPPMMKSLKEQLRKAGVPKSRIHSEEFRIL